MMKGFQMRRYNILFIALFTFSYFCADPIFGEGNLGGTDKSGVQIEIDVSKSVGPLKHIWNGNMGNLGLVLIPQGEELLRLISETTSFPFYRRCIEVTSNGVGLSNSNRIYGSTNVYHVDSTGRPFYDFTLFDQIFDIMIERNIVPFMCIGFMPDSLSAAPDSDRQSESNINRYPPKDYDKWYDLMYSMVKHCIERYGREAVTKWKWEVWNEPDLHNFWRGTQEEYFKLYDYSAAAIKDALPNAEVGGNAITHSVRSTPFLIRFIKHCLRGTNYRDGSKGAPLDFITFHLKSGYRSFKKTGNFTSKELIKKSVVFSPDFQFLFERARAIMSEISSVQGVEGIPVYITECDIDIGVQTSLYENPKVAYRNTEYYAAYQCALVKEMLEVAGEFPSNPIESIMMDSFFYPGRRLFEGQRTIVTADNIVKPVFNALRILGKLGTERLHFRCSKKDNINGLASISDDNTIQVMIYNYHNDVNYKDSKLVNVNLKVPSKKSYMFTHYRIDQHHSNSYAVWKSYGKPVIPNESQMKTIKARQGLEKYNPDRRINVENNSIEVSFDLPHHSVSLLIFKPVN